MTRSRSLLPRCSFVLALSLAACHSPHLDPSDPPGGIEASGILAPVGPPLEPPTRTEDGEGCIVDVRQAYALTGTLSGTAEVTYRIRVAGPCGSPAGTFDEEWVAQGVFRGTREGSAAAGKFSYRGQVRAGGQVEGRIVLGQGLVGELRVHGNLRDGELTYVGTAQ